MYILIHNYIIHRQQALYILVHMEGLHMERLHMERLHMERLHMERLHMEGRGGYL